MRRDHGVRRSTRAAVQIPSEAQFRPRLVPKPKFRSSVFRALSARSVDHAVSRVSISDFDKRMRGQTRLGRGVNTMLNSRSLRPFSQTTLVLPTLDVFCVKRLSAVETASLVYRVYR